MKFLHHLKHWWHHRQYRHRFSATVFVDSRQILPDQLLDDHIYVVGPRDAPKWVVMTCPCRQGHRLDVCLMPTVSPHWRLKLSRRQQVTLSPSVWVSEVCTSHFWVYANRVEWVRDYYAR